MSIWILYTECNSEPRFMGYTTSKTKAKEWMFDSLRLDYKNNPKHIFNDNGDSMSISVNGRESEQFIQTEKVERIV